MAADRPLRGGDEAVPTGREAAVRDGHEGFGITLAVDDGLENRPAAHPEDVADQTGQLDVGVFEDLLDAEDVAGHLLPQLLARPVEISNSLGAHRLHSHLAVFHPRRLGGADG